MVFFSVVQTANRWRRAVGCSRDNISNRSRFAHLPPTRAPAPRVTFQLFAEVLFRRRQPTIVADAVDARVVCLTSSWYQNMFSHRRTFSIPTTQPGPPQRCVDNANQTRDGRESPVEAQITDGLLRFFYSHPFPSSEEMKLLARAWGVEKDVLDERAYALTCTLMDVTGLNDLFDDATNADQTVETTDCDEYETFR